ncbi:hypothetical protein OSO01_19190 [Oceanobacillus sojae]|uniref:Uncharacterized protein n=1 Tax=Oceanobacillus sojae TaxID=582851 RepID=A0A511ZIC0_9BACI|nr:hypothetical protein OSO01_19190 [Oceanobacillus sojae]
MVPRINSSLCYIMETGFFMFLNFTFNRIGGVDHELPSAICGRNLYPFTRVIGSG